VEKKERDYWEDVCVGGRKILKLILEKQFDLAWTGFIWLMHE
jgi:hypothetical protein